MFLKKKKEKENKRERGFCLEVAHFEWNVTWLWFCKDDIWIVVSFHK